MSCPAYAGEMSSVAGLTSDLLTQAQAVMLSLSEGGISVDDAVKLLFEISDGFADLAGQIDSLGVPPPTLEESARLFRRAELLAQSGTKQIAVSLSIGGNDGLDESAIDSILEAGQLMKDAVAVASCP